MFVELPETLLQRSTYQKTRKGDRNELSQRLLELWKQPRSGLTLHLGTKRRKSGVRVLFRKNEAVHVERFLIYDVEASVAAGFAKR